MIKKETLKNQILEIVERFEDGIAIQQLLLGLDSNLSRRTLQRNLNELIDLGLIAFKGTTKSRRYYVIHQIKKVPLDLQNPIPLSKKGHQIFLNISQPIQARFPVSYKREFLDAYKPNVTFYLKSHELDRLKELSTMEYSHFPAGTYGENLMNKLLVDLSWNSSRLEGNTYSLLETKELIQNGKIPIGKNLQETQMILNHKAAIEFILSDEEIIGINRYTVLNLHTLLSDNLMQDPDSCGRLRSHAVGISHSTYQPLAIPQLIEEMFDLILEKAKMIQNPFEQAFFLLVHLPYLQSFDDVNKRTSRLSCNLPLIKNKLVPLSFTDVPEEVYIKGLLAVYELNEVDLLKDVFLWAYERSSLYYSTLRKTIGEPDPFKLKYRNAIKTLIHDIVLSNVNKLDAVSMIVRYINSNIAPKDACKFQEVVERELISLHMGNIAKYKLSLESFEKWKKNQD